jgi:glucosamine--fructose-6-phosphate aminotransferase (isomerizing)
VLARAWSVADFEHGPIAVVEPGFPVVLVDGRGQVSADMESIGQRLSDHGCRLIRLLDGAGDHGYPETTVSLDSGLPEELTPLTLAVLGQLLAHRVALARGIDPDRPRAINKVTRTW